MLSDMVLDSFQVLCGNLIPHGSQNYIYSFLGFGFSQSDFAKLIIHYRKLV